MSKQPPSAPTASAIGPCLTIIQIVGRPGTGSLPRAIAPSDHPWCVCVCVRGKAGRWIVLNCNPWKIVTNYSNSFKVRNFVPAKKYDKQC